MNPGQAMFYDFAMQRVQAGREEELRAVMEESFRRQDEGTFTKEYMAQIAPKMISLLRPECVQEFAQAAAHMASTLK